MPGDCERHGRGEERGDAKCRHTQDSDGRRRRLTRLSPISASGCGRLHPPSATRTVPVIHGVSGPDAPRSAHAVLRRRQWLAVHAIAQRWRLARDLTVADAAAPIRRLSLCPRYVVQGLAPLGPRGALFRDIPRANLARLGLLPDVPRPGKVQKSPHGPCFTDWSRPAAVGVPLASKPSNRRGRLGDLGIESVFSTGKEATSSTTNEMGGIA